METNIISITRTTDSNISEENDTLAVEAPLEIQLISSLNPSAEPTPYSMTMRTPALDEALAVGFLYSEGIIDRADDIVSVKTDQPTYAKIKGQGRVIVTLKKALPNRLEKRNTVTSSGCGVCSKESTDALSFTPPHLPPSNTFNLHHRDILSLSNTALEQQIIFQQTGGVHATGLFSLDGTLESLGEDVGRHNAMDKVIGAALLKGALPLHDKILFASGRLSYELVQKTIMAGAAGLISVGAPSSLAVQLASEYNLLMIGFLSKQRYNIYNKGRCTLLNPS